MRSAIARDVHFDLSARSLSLSGKAEIAADGLPEWFDVTGTLASPDNAPVILPFGESIRLSRAEFHLATKPGDKDSWSGEVSVDGFDQPDMKIARMRLDGSGRVGRTPAGNSFGGTLNLLASGIAPMDPALAEQLARAGVVHWAPQECRTPDGPPTWGLTPAQQTLLQAQFPGFVLRSGL